MESLIGLLVLAMLAVPVLLVVALVSVSGLKRRIADLEGKGHHGLLISMDSKDTPEALVEAIQPQGAVTAFYYRTFIIEDLIPQQPLDSSPQSVVVGTHAAEGDMHPTVNSDQPR